MHLCSLHRSIRRKTTPGRRLTLILVLFGVVLAGGCSASKPAEAEEAEALARTEFTDRIENFFEYEPLRAGHPSQFLIHLTDLTDGTPVERAEVVLTARARGGEEATETKARVGKVTGIYVADVELERPGKYDIEFCIKNAKLDERMALTEFTVE
jgi:hypothetical protein